MRTGDLLNDRSFLQCPTNVRSRLAEYCLLDLHQVIQVHASYISKVKQSLHNTLQPFGLVTTAELVEALKEKFSVFVVTDNESVVRLSNNSRQIISYTTATQKFSLVPSFSNPVIV